MIKEVTMYTVICDNCGKDCFQDQEYSAHSCAEYADEIAMESEWEKIDDKHYCGDCYEYNDDDELIVKQPQLLQK